MPNSSAFASISCFSITEEIWSSLKNIPAHLLLIKAKALRLSDIDSIAIDDDAVAR